MFFDELYDKLVDNSITKTLVDKLKTYNNAKK